MEVLVAETLGTRKRRLELDLAAYRNVKYSQTQVCGHHIITDSLLCPWGGKALTLSLNSTRLMRTPRSYGHFLWLPQCPWGLRKTGFCESGRNYSCPLTRVSVRRTSTVIAFDSSERIPILVFLWYKATNLRDIGATAELAAATDFVRSISAGKVDSFRLDFVSMITCSHS